MKNKTLTLACLIAVAAIPLQSQNQNVGPQAKEADMTVYGIRLGGKLSIPECKRSVKNKYFPVPPSDVMQVTSLCFAWKGINIPEPNTPVITDEVEIYFPAFGTPHGLLTGAEASADNLPGPIEGQIVDGNIEAITLYTEGLQFQDLVLTTLKEKYGEPTEFKEKSKQNALGAVFASHSAAWRFSNLAVSFEGTINSTNVGYIFICTNKGTEYILKTAKQRPQAGPKM